MSEHCHIVMRSMARGQWRAQVTADCYNISSTRVSIRHQSQNGRAQRFQEIDNQSPTPQQLLQEMGHCSMSVATSVVSVTTHIYLSYLFDPICDTGPCNLNRSRLCAQRLDTSNNDRRVATDRIERVADEVGDRAPKSGWP